MKAREREIQRAILDYLKLRRIFCWKQNTVGIQKADGTYIPAGLRGVADILGVLPDGRFLAIEVKSPGGRVSVDQRLFLNNVEINKGFQLVAYSVEDVIEAGL